MTTDEPYVGGQESTPQHVLYLLKKSGARVPLCGSVDEKLIADLKSELEGGPISGRLAKS